MFVAGAIAGLLLYLQQQQIMSINMEKLQELSAFIITAAASFFDKTFQFGDATALGIPLIGGISAGLAIGLTRG
jgi:hypothetical protein